MNLTPHFTYAELTASDYAIRNGLANMPDDPHVLGNMHLLADGLERVRAVIGQPIHITSGYRSPDLNAAIGGSKTSAHMRGLAADFVVPGMSPLAVCKRIVEHADMVRFDQVIHEGRWTHIAFPEADDQPRLASLTAIFMPGKPVTYVQGVA